MPQAVEAGLLRIVSLAGYPFAVMFRPSVLRLLCCSPITVIQIISSLTAKISCYIVVTVFVHKDKLQVAYKSATCNLSLRIKARTEHACLKTSGFSNVHVQLSPFLICYIQWNCQSCFLLLRPTPKRSVTRLVVIQTPLVMATSCY